MTAVVEVDWCESATALFVRATSLALRTKSPVSPFVFRCAATRPQTDIARTTRKTGLRRWAHRSPFEEPHAKMSSGIARDVPSYWPCNLAEFSRQGPNSCVVSRSSRGYLSVAASPNALSSLQITFHDLHEWVDRIERHLPVETFRHDQILARGSDSQLSTWNLTVIEPDSQPRLFLE